jgi:hypothetical protein
MDSDYFEKLRSRDQLPTEQVLDLIGFTESRVGGYERKWGNLEVGCAEWLGSWHFAGWWVTSRELGFPEFRVGPMTSPASLLATLYDHCGSAFSRSLWLPTELRIGKEELEYRRKTRALTPQPPTVWADRKYLRFCLNYIRQKLGDDSCLITVSASDGQLKIDCAPQSLTVYCPVRGEWVGTSEIAAESLFRLVPKRFNRPLIALLQYGDKVTIDSRNVPARFVEVD